MSFLELVKLILPFDLFKLALVHFGVLIVELRLRPNIGLFLQLLQVYEFLFILLLSFYCFRFVVLHKMDISFVGLEFLIRKLKLQPCLVVGILFILKLVLKRL